MSYVALVTDRFEEVVQFYGEGLGFPLVVMLRIAHQTLIRQINPSTRAEFAPTAQGFPRRCRPSAPPSRPTTTWN